MTVTNLVLDETKSCLSRQQFLTPSLGLGNVFICDFWISIRAKGSLGISEGHMIWNWNEVCCLLYVVAVRWKGLGDVRGRAHQP